MKANIFMIVFAGLFFISCNEATKPQSAESREPATDTIPIDGIVSSSLTDKNGNKLDMSFDNSADIATIFFEGDTAELAGQRPASGIWYKNDRYELRGKGSAVELTRDGKTVFKN